jgi:hypothetical protein
MRQQEFLKGPHTSISQGGIAFQKAASFKFLHGLFFVCNPLNIMSVFSLFFTTDLLPVLPSRLSALL